VAKLARLLDDIYKCNLCWRPEFGPKLIYYTLIVTVF